jgi:hypothetical protein
MIVMSNLTLKESRIDAEEGTFWMCCAGAPKVNLMARLGRYAYSRACFGVTPKERQRISTIAADLFLFGLRHDPCDAFCALSLAFMLRRQEIPESPYPSFDALVHDLLEQKNAGAIVNQAMRLASGYRCQINWQAADELFQSLSGSLGIFEWWLACAREGDAEGNLVLAWLMRMSLTAEIDGINIESRLEMARRRFPDAPDWMCQPIR